MKFGIEFVPNQPLDEIVKLVKLAEDGIRDVCR